MLKTAFYDRGRGGIRVPPLLPPAPRSDHNARKRGGSGEVLRNLRRQPAAAVAASHARAAGFYDPWNVCVLAVESFVHTGYLEIIATFS